MRVALVHDYLNQYGGAERVLDELMLLFPDAPIYTSIYHPEQMPARYRWFDIRTSWLDRVPVLGRRHQMLLGLLPQAFESFDLNAYDLVVSSSSGFAHGVLTGPSTTHVCYCHSPPRFLWDYHHYVERERIGPVVQAALGTRLTALRVWDRVAAERADVRVATSRLVQMRIRKHYGQDSTVIPPPVDVGRFEVGEGAGRYFLMLMRLVGWKRPDIVVESCSRLNLPLVVAGDGRELPFLRALAGPSVRFVGRVDDLQMKSLYRDCRALILPSEEDFGITPLEAMAAGRPVIAFGRGGVLDTVEPGLSGLFFEPQTSQALDQALAIFQRQRFDPRLIRRQAERFDRTIFRARLRRLIDEVLERRQRLVPALPPGELEAAG